MKKAAIFLIILIVICSFFYKMFNGGIRGGDVFKDTASTALEYETGVDYASLTEPIDCTDKYSLQIFEDTVSKCICCGVFEKRDNKYAYVYACDFNSEEITYDSGLEYFDVHKNGELIFGIMPDVGNDIKINNSIIATNINFEYGNKAYICWYAIVDGGFDNVKEICYVPSENQ